MSRFIICKSQSHFHTILFDTLKGKLHILDILFIYTKHVQLTEPCYFSQNIPIIIFPIPHFPQRGILSIFLELFLLLIIFLHLLFPPQNIICHFSPSFFKISYSPSFYFTSFFPTHTAVMQENSLSVLAGLTCAK